mgnify:CR=1 FL=1
MTTNTKAKPRKADKMRTTPPHQLLLKMGIPMICSMVLQAMYKVPLFPTCRKMEKLL